MAKFPLIDKRDNDDDHDLIDLDFVQSWAAIGDSFTAGIGSGTQLGNPISGSADWLCSRYSYTWPRLVDNAIGPAKKKFQFPACSGDRSEGIYRQAQGLEGDLDLVMLTAGGNDLCLAAMIRTCVLLPYSGEDACTRVINKAQENIDTILKNNIRQVLEALKPKMKNKNGIVIYNGYAPFFNTDNEDCATKQNWAIKSWGSWRYWLNKGLTLTVDRRKKFNTLVSNINKAIEEVVQEFQKDRNKKYDIEFSDWSAWPAEVDGQMCSPRGDGHYPEAKQPDQQFFQPSTWLRTRWNDDVELERASQRLLLGTNLYDSLLYKSADPRATALHQLDPRAVPKPPECPGDGDWDPTLGLGLPDTFGRVFHPNEKGHETIAAFALQNLAYVRAAQLGKRRDFCDLGKDEFTCWQTSEKRKAYTSYNSVSGKVREFCDDVERNRDRDRNNWHYAKTYYEGTPDVFEFKIQLTNDARDFIKSQCVESLDRIINSCDGNDPTNPMNWKFGGKWVRESYEYEINPKKNRAMITRPDAACNSRYDWLYDTYWFYGKGWCNNDWGGQSMLPAARDCVRANGVTGWSFEYYAKPEDHDGWEWKAEFKTHVWTKGRCFGNLNVQRAAGGYSHEWRDRHEDEKYQDAGCAGNG
ncbi:SGNH hydrolase-type esterase domain-containing protein [Immersiella caudata]|uniref:SGNH hydrolase-type esterase domain-containing protein n=1 Tax=Immersiella caudata TaxID=314043 RepID=A0AA39WD94_9PEZI|nr:SGNH hydrolase-type esterase domain-containing protein [Immersiella caudata]